MSLRTRISWAWHLADLCRSFLKFRWRSPLARQHFLAREEVEKLANGFETVNRKFSTDVSVGGSLDSGKMKFPDNYQDRKKLACRITRL
jgi:hypothetical protein